MGTIDYLRPLILAGGFLFILVGLNILIAEQPTHSASLTSLYQLTTIVFYLYMVLAFLTILVNSLKALLNYRK